MVRVKEKLTIESVLLDKNRRKIAVLCEDIKNFTQLQNILKISAGSLAHHLRILEDVGIIKRKKIKIDGREKRGGEVSIGTTEIYKKYKQEKPDYNEPIFEEKNTFKVLDVLKKSKKPLTSEEVQQKSNIQIDVDYYLETLELNDLIEKKFNITKEGNNLHKEKKITNLKPYDKIYTEEDDKISEEKKQNDKKTTK